MIYSRFRYRILSVCVLLVTLLALLLSGEHVAMLAIWWPWSGSMVSNSLSHADKVIHAALFAACGYFIVLGWLTRTVQLLPLYLALLILGGCTEWLQAQIPGRGPDPWDLVADAVGAALGVASGLLRLKYLLSR
jgi:hypothetical protein